MEVNPKYVEILRLNKMLTEAKIPHSIEIYFDGWQICYPSKEIVLSDAIEHCGSYGRDDDLIETAGLSSFKEIEEETKEENVVGYLTAEEVFKLWKKHYYKKGNN